jgi:hypothetical protein
MTLTEVLVVVVVLAVLAAVFFPTLLTIRNGRMPVSCIDNLKQIGLSFRVWAGDHNDKFPMQVSITDTNGGGTMELANGRNGWLNFFVMSNELCTPRLLICPADIDKVAATNFSTDLVGKISYFVGLNADQDHPPTFLSGDDNFAIGGVPVKSDLLELSTNAPISWTAARHKYVGNIVLTDGSAWQTDDKQLVQKLIETGLATNRLAIP